MKMNNEKLVLVQHNNNMNRPLAATITAAITLGVVVLIFVLNGMGENPTTELQAIDAMAKIRRQSREIRLVVRFQPTASDVQPITSSRSNGMNDTRKTDAEIMARISGK